MQHVIQLIIVKLLYSEWRVCAEFLPSDIFLFKHLMKQHGPASAPCLYVSVCVLSMETENAWECYFTHPLHLMRSFCQWCEKNSLTLQAFFAPVQKFKIESHLFKKKKKLISAGRAASEAVLIGCVSCLWTPATRFKISSGHCHLQKKPYLCWCWAKTNTVSISMSTRCLLSCAFEHCSRFIL